MKLANRFNNEVREFWIGHYECAICKRNTASQIHHIVSPTANDYINGEHNTSVLNSVALCQECHINKPLQNRKTQGVLLNYTLNLVAMRNYEIKEKDNKFYSLYNKLY
jgi:5-methylcytosine-specific restriction endonuclease McrA